MISEKNFLWVEEYRPKTVADCILPEALKASFQTFVDQKEIPNLILSGTAGVGKTTIARAMCEEIGADYILINGSVENGIDTLRMKVMSFASAASLTGGRKVIIIDEADNLTPEAQKGFRGVIEEFAGNCSFIFTCNFIKRIIEPLHSRCACIDFRLQGKDKALMAMGFFKRIETILKLEEVEYDKAAVTQLVTKFFPDYRRILNELQRYSRNGKIDDGILTNLANVKIDELVEYLKAKEFKSVRKWVGNNSDTDSAAIMRSLYDKMADIFKPQCLPALIILLAKYQYQESFCADKEISLMACMMEIMCECEIK